MTSSGTTLTIWLEQLPKGLYLSDESCLRNLKVSWLFSDEIQYNRGTIEQLIEVIARIYGETGVPVDSTVVIPGELVTSMKITAPNKRALKVVPYLIEDRLGAPLEEIHISHHSWGEATKLLVLCIDVNLMQKLLLVLDEARINCRSLIPDYALLPNSETLLYCPSDDRLLCRLPNGEGFCLPKQQLSFVEAIAQQSGFQMSSLEIESVELMRSAGSDSQRYTLLTGSFKPKTRKESRSWLQTTTIALASCLLLLISYALIVGWQFHAKAENYYAMAEQHYRDLFPETQRITNLRRQLQGKLNAVHDSSERSSKFLRILNDSAPALNSNSEYTVRQIRYNDSQETLQIDLVARNMDLLNELQKNLQEQHLVPTIRSVNSGEAGVVARLNIAQAEAQ